MIEEVSHSWVRISHLFFLSFFSFVCEPFPCLRYRDIFFSSLSGAKHLISYSLLVARYLNVRCHGAQDICHAASCLAFQFVLACCDRFPENFEWSVPLYTGISMHVQFSYFDLALPVSLLCIYDTSFSSSEVCPFIFRLKPLFDMLSTSGRYMSRCVLVLSRFLFGSSPPCGNDKISRARPALMLLCVTSSSVFFVNHK